jgi:hypothetical protein
MVLVSRLGFSFGVNNLGMHVPQGSGKRGQPINRLGIQAINEKPCGQYAN